MMTETETRLSALREGVSRVKTYRDVLQSQASAHESREKEMRYKADLHQRCTEVFKTWLEDSLEKNVNSMAELATAGLKHVIHDQDLTFRIFQDPKLNRLHMRFVLEDRGEGGTVEGDPLASFGGGAAVVISLVLRLAVMARMNMGNLLLLDESMVALAQAYVPSAASFMRQLAEETGVNILMVTHNPEFLAHAHVAYEGTKEAGGLKLRRLRAGTE